MRPKASDSPRYIVGIDLGTTHTVAACAELDGSQSAGIELFPLEQLIAPGQVAPRSLLPSVRYHASLEEVTEADVRLPWSIEPPPEGYRLIVGELARKLGAKSRGRFVASAKSWLCHPGVDRTAPILPWGALEAVPKVSPVEASASYLRHVRAAWNHRHPEAPLEDQEIVITVPASFDEAARALTLLAAKTAGLSRVRLLEEPQAVCYDWLWQHRRSLHDQLQDLRLLLVCDVGGGTTDLTLIKVESGEGQPRLARIAVGNHLMLGGDNIDLTLAHRIESRLVGADRRLSAAELALLVEQCRLAKESLLAEDAPESLTVTLLGAGGRLIGGARSAELTREEVRQVVLEGFLPLVGLDDHPDRRRSGVVEFGLPYTADPAVTRHLAAFLTQHRAAALDALGLQSGLPVPDGLLLNGGMFRSRVIAERLVELMEYWKQGPVKLLENERPDLAVAYGAVASAMARRGRAVQRIGGGSARSYFLLVETQGDEIPRGICVLPRGTEEGREIVLADRTFALKLGHPVRFHLASSNEDTPFRPGELVALDDEHFSLLPPLAAAFTTERLTGRAEPLVQLAASLTEIGTLQVQCVALEDPARRWDVEFQLRGSAVASLLLESQAHPRWNDALERVQHVFGKKTKRVEPKTVKSLRNDLEKLLGPREQWDTPLLRALCAALLDGLPHRRRSPDHERLWLSLTGFCLRPGYGYPLDDWRVEQVFATYGQGLQFVNEAQNWSEWWTLWRRIAGGLSAEAQEQIFADIADFINPETAKRGNLPTLARKRSYEDMVRLAAVLERLPVTTKERVGAWLLQRLAKASEPEQTWWALGRVGARVPLYGSAHNVVPQRTAEAWLEQCLAIDFKKNPSAGFAATLIARMSGDRERDIDVGLRARLEEKLRGAKAPHTWITLITVVQELSEADEKRIFGEALPPGLKLIG